MNTGPISRLLSSSKALVMLATMAGAVALVMTGKITWEQAEKFLTVTVPAWMLAVGLEDAAKHFGEGKGRVATPASEKPAGADVGAGQAKPD